MSLVLPCPTNTVQQTMPLGNHGVFVVSATVLIFKILLFFFFFLYKAFYISLSFPCYSLDRLTSDMSQTKGTTSLVLDWCSDTTTQMSSSEEFVSIFRDQMIN